jgi:hypothetical protein
MIDLNERNVGICAQICHGCDEILAFGKFDLIDLSELRSHVAKLGVASSALHRSTVPLRNMALDPVRQPARLNFDRASIRSPKERAHSGCLIALMPSIERIGPVGREVAELPTRSPEMLGAFGDRTLSGRSVTHQE